MSTEGFSHYKEFLIILCVAGLVVPVFMRVGINAVLSFLLVGILLSPGVLGQAVTAIPALQALVLGNPEQLASLAELGVVFLLFLIGLELSFERFATMRRLVFGLGALQVLLSFVAVALGAVALGLETNTAIVLGAAFCLSSTAIVVQLLSDAKRLGSQTGRATFSILLFQDLAVIPLLLLVSVLGRTTNGSVLTSVALAIGQAAIAITVIVLVGRFALRPLLRLVAGTNSSDLFMAATLLIAVGTGVAATAAGLSMSLGAFIAGLMLAETEYRRAVEAIIEPFKGLLLGAFFLLVGLGLDVNTLLSNPLRVAALTIAVIAIKAVTVYILARLFRVPRGSAAESAALLGPCGEFAFVILAAAAAADLVDSAINREALLIVTLSMLAIPLFARAGAGVNLRLKHSSAVAATVADLPLPDDAKPRVIVAGFGRVGHLIGSMLDEHGIAYIAIDMDADLVARERRAGFPVYYGDAANAAFLGKCGLSLAPALAITMDNPLRVDDVTRVARAQRADLKIIARARDERHAIRLYGAGVTEAVPETIESSLQLGEALLVETGVPMGLAIASVHERRDGFRKLLGRPNRREQLDIARKRLRRKQTLK